MRFEDIRVGDHLIFIDRSNNINHYISTLTIRRIDHDRVTVDRKYSNGFYIILDNSFDKYFFYDREACLFERYP
jgi:hypothetical protein